MTTFWARSVSPTSPSRFLVGGPAGFLAIDWPKASRHRKPEDVKVDDKLPELGKTGSFAVPYKTEQGNAGPFLRRDLSVIVILGAVRHDVFRTLLTVNGGEPIDWAQIPTISAAPSPNKMPPVIYILRDGKKTTARLVLTE